MSKLMTPDEMIAALKKWGVKFIEYQGWRTRGRPGDSGQRNGLVIHHTGSKSQSDDYLHFLFVTGRPEEGIPGPLCNVSTDMDGELHLGASGRANHAGRGSLTTLKHVQAEDYGYTRELRPGPDNIDGNDYFYGNEIRYTGANPMTPAAYRTALLHAAAICDFYGWSALSVIGHREHTSRKDDPGHNPMDKFRRDLDAVLKAGPEGKAPGTTPTLPGQDLTIHAYAIWYGSTQPKPMNKTDEVWGDIYQVMAFASHPKIAVNTIAQRDWWVKLTTDPKQLDWVKANDMVKKTVQKLQAKWGLPTTGLMDARTAAWFRGYGYTIL